MRPFFTDNGFIPKTDVIIETVNDGITQKIVVCSNTSPAWLQKLTAVNGGHEGQEIEAYPVERCTLCQPIEMQHQRPENSVERFRLRHTSTVGDSLGMSSMEW